MVISKYLSVIATSGILATTLTLPGAAAAADNKELVDDACAKKAVAELTRD